MNIKSTIAAAALALSAPAFAAYDVTGTVNVQYGDLDLTSDAGMAHLQRRMHRAAEQICGYVPPRGVTEQQKTAECQGDVIAQANANLEPALAAAGRGGVRLAQVVRTAR